MFVGSTKREDKHFTMLRLLRIKNKVFGYIRSLKDKANNIVFRHRTTLIFALMCFMLLLIVMIPVVVIFFSADGEPRVRASQICPSNVKITWDLFIYPNTNNFPCIKDRSYLRKYCCSYTSECSCVDVTMDYDNEYNKQFQKRVEMAPWKRTCEILMICIFVLFFCAYSCFTALVKYDRNISDKDRLV